MAAQNVESVSQFWRFDLYSEMPVADCPVPTMKTTPRVGGVPSPAYSPWTKSRTWARVVPAFARTEDGNSFTAQVSPFVTANPADSIRCRASTPAAYHVDEFAATQR